ncbi:MAG: non-canonical purine NTP pyrophosphatase [Spirochaetales bacterium]
MILLATNNGHKKGELELLFPGVVLALPSEVGLAGWDHNETADSFAGNALGKARSLFEQAGRRWPVMADDSGICVDALGGAPGIFSARYGADEGRKLDDVGRYRLLLERLGARADRSARFVCALVLVLGPHREFVVEETWEGEVAHTPSGTAGFGYDPVFWLPELGCTSADLSSAQKNNLSHRARASRRLAAVIATLEDFA